MNAVEEGCLEDVEVRYSVYPLSDSETAVNEILQSTRTRKFTFNNYLREINGIYGGAGSAPIEH